MDKYKLKSAETSAFCNDFASLLAAGIQFDEAASILLEDASSEGSRAVCEQIYKSLSEGQKLGEAIEETDAFPTYVVRMVKVGERTGFLEPVLKRLAVYYDEEAYLLQRVRSGVGYPAAMLCIMAIILAFTVAFILPAFIDVYENYSGTISSGSFEMVGISIPIGWIVLIVTMICAAASLICVFMLNRTNGLNSVLHLFSKLPLTRGPIYHIGESRALMAIAIFQAAGTRPDVALLEVAQQVDDARLRNVLNNAYSKMEGESHTTLSVSLMESGLINVMSARSMAMETRTGSFEGALMRISEEMFARSVAKLDRLINSIEPVFAAFLTIAVGLSLIAVMLPLIGIMGSIG